MLEKDFGLQVKRLYRKNIVYSPSRFDEINIYGEARKNGKKIYVVGESKAQFGARDVSRFSRLIERVRSHLGEEVFPLTLAYHYHPRAEQRLKESQIPYYWSFELSPQ